ncbi:MAG: penicillin-insensitive murein endopeptidase [Woeseiaceae bacterium]
MKKPSLVSGVILVLIALPGEAREPSVCHGTTSNGSLENGWQIPTAGPNFSTHWTTGRLLGRSFVHSSVHAVILDAYAALQETMPDTVFVYGETGKKSGGEFAPHKTHRNGLSVDFMVPVLNENGDSVPLPSNVLNKWGYDLEFDSAGTLDGLTIDYAAIAEHIYQLHIAAQQADIGIWRVIFDPQLQPYLKTSPRWPYLQQNVQFSERPSWVRHDEHFHVDFDVECMP